MTAYVISQEGERDLEQLWDYIAEDSLDAADSLVSKIFDAFEDLARNPKMGHKREDLTRYPVLFWPVGNYLVIYRVKQRCIHVVAVVMAHEMFLHFCADCVEHHRREHGFGAGYVASMINRLE